MSVYVCWWLIPAGWITPCSALPLPIRRPITIMSSTCYKFQLSVQFSLAPLAWTSMATSITSRDPSLNEHTVRDSISVTSNNKEPISEKALEDATPKYDDSKILQGRKLALAFVAMLLSVLLIALGMFDVSAYGSERPTNFTKTKQLLHLHCRISTYSFAKVLLKKISQQTCHCFPILSPQPDQLDSQRLFFNSYVDAFSIHWPFYWKDTECSFLLLYGSLLTIYDRKYV